MQYCTVCTDLRVQHPLQVLHAAPPAGLMILLLHPEHRLCHLTHLPIPELPETDHVAAVGHLAVLLPTAASRVAHEWKLKSQVELMMVCMYFCKTLSSYTLS